MRSFETACVVRLGTCAVLKQPIVFFFFEIRSFETACAVFLEKCAFFFKPHYSVSEKSAVLKQPVLRGMIAASD